MRIGDRAIAAGIAAARRAGVRASGEQLHGTPARRLEEFARLRDAQFIVVGHGAAGLAGVCRAPSAAAQIVRCWWLGVRVRWRPDATPTA
jgi:nucleotide-binding universal stress UspA family protein